MTRFHDPDPGFDPRVADWLETDPNDAPGQILETVQAAIPAIPQRRSLRLPRRSMDRVTYLAAAVMGAAVLGIATVVGGSLLNAPLPSDGPTATGPTVAPSPSVHQARNGVIAVAKAEAILLIDPTTSETLRTLDVPSTSGAEVTWSPDGQRLALAVPGGVWVMELSGATPQKILDCGIEAEACSIAWSPDGLVIAVAHGGQLELIDPDGSNRTPVHVQEGIWQPTWSPDGARIAYRGWDGVSDGNDEPGLYVVNRDGSEPTLLLGPLPGIGAFDPAWSPDGSKIAYIGSTDRRTCSGASKIVGCTDDWRLHLMVLALDGSEPHELHPAGTCACITFAPSLTWSPDGRSLAMDGPGGEGVPSGLVVVEADGTGVRQLLADAGMPAWQPLP
jgi:Tol biopolymer transport system component